MQNSAANIALKNAVGVVVEQARGVTLIAFKCP